MQASDLPAKNPIPFAISADSAHRRAIPTPSQASSGNDAPASFTDGFPPLTFVDPAAGGIPPNGKDMNGILFFLSQWTRWQAMGGPTPFDAGFSSAMPTPGYPLGARVPSAVTPGLTWVSTANNNTTDPDSAGAANWTWEGDLGHVFNSGLGYVTFGPLIFNFGSVVLPDNSGVVAVTFARAFGSQVLARGAANDCGSQSPVASAGTGNPTMTGMNIGMMISGPGPNTNFTAARAGTAATWWALGI